jgi:predicted enzyme related to lactoylglutathione lyase
MKESPMSFTPPAALAINHVGVTVPDIHAAIDWYEKVFGFRCISGPFVLEADEYTAAIFGNRFRRAWQAHLLSGNSVGIELFQFIDPPTRGPRSAHERAPRLDSGPWHLCITHPNVQGMVDHIVDHGGTLLASPHQLVPGGPWTVAYTTDPWANLLELMNHSYAEVISNWPQPGQLTPPIPVRRANRDDHGRDESG